MRCVVNGNGQGICEGLGCLHCGEYLDPVILVNRSSEMRAFWRTQTDFVFNRLTPEEKNLQEYEPEAILLSF